MTKITLEKLARMVQAGFNGTDKRIANLQKQVMYLSEGLGEKMEQTAKQTVAAVDALMDKKIEDHERRLVRVEKYLGIKF